MSRRYSCKACAVVEAGTAHTHLLGAAPDEWAINLRGPAHGASMIYIQGAPGAATMTVAASGAAGTCDVFAFVNHSIVK
jgi:hypothetical protein